MSDFDYKKYIAENPLLEELGGVEVEPGDSMEINPDAYPDYQFPQGVVGVVHSIDNGDHAVDDLVYTVKLKHIDPMGGVGELIYVENPNQFI